MLMFAPHSPFHQRLAASGTAIVWNNKWYGANRHWPDLAPTAELVTVTATFVNGKNPFRWE